MYLFIVQSCMILSTYPRVKSHFPFLTPSEGATRHFPLAWCHFFLFWLSRLRTYFFAAFFVARGQSSFPPLLHPRLPRRRTSRTVSYREQGQTLFKDLHHYMNKKNSKIYIGAKRSFYAENCCLPAGSWSHPIEKICQGDTELPIPKKNYDDKNWLTKLEGICSEGLTELDSQIDKLAYHNNNKTESTVPRTYFVQRPAE